MESPPAEPLRTLRNHRNDATIINQAHMRAAMLLVQGGQSRQAVDGIGRVGCPTGADH